MRGSRALPGAETAGGSSQDRLAGCAGTRLLHSGELTPVWVPDEDHEALRDPVRAREDAKQARQRKRHREACRQGQ